ncbi:MAG TPA: HEAT repeat domain-containing protein [Longimicrobium sp.]|nr:HEAT repeat domain-containing protein [Longimicrobium sp.]
MQLARQEYRAASQTLREVSARHPDAAAAGEAAYWEAVALYELGDRAALDEAFAAVDSLQRNPMAVPAALLGHLSSRLCRRLAELDPSAANATSACGGAVTRSAVTPCNGDEGRARASAVAALVSAEAPGAWQALREFVADTACAPELRRQALALTTEFPTDTILPVLLAVSRDTSERLALRAISLLGEASDARAVERLAEVAREEDDPRIRDRALSALQENPAPEARAHIRTLANGSGDLRAEAIEAIADNPRGPDDIAYLRDLLPRVSVAQQRRIVRSLGESANDDQARGWVLGVASSAAYADEVRHEAVRTIGESAPGIAALIHYYDQPQAAPLRSLLLRIFRSEGKQPGRRKLAEVAESDPDPELRLEAARLLRRALAEDSQDD